MKRNINQQRGKGLLSPGSILLLLALLFFPILATLRLSRSIDQRMAPGYLLLISGVTYLFYRHDKRRAEDGGRRTPESTLHLAEFAGGWPGAFLAQRALRHKISKTKYQVEFWAIVVLHEFVSFDFLQDWRFSRLAFSLIR